MSRILRIAFTIMACWVLAGCRDASPSEPAPSTIRLQLNWVPEPEFGGIYAADAAGFFRDEGLQVEIIKGGPGVAAPQLAASGRVEFAVVGGEQILTLGEAGGELVGIYAIYQDDPMAVMVHATSPFASLEELWKSDATVACEANLSWVTMLNEKFGGASLKIVPHGGSIALFAADSNLAQQCFVFAEPVALEMQGVATKVFLVKESGFNPYNGVIATSAAYAKANPETCAKVRRALQRGWERYLKDPAPTNAVMAAMNPAMTKEAMDIAAKRQQPLIESPDTERLGLGAMTAERWSNTAQQLQRLGKITTLPAPEEIFLWGTSAPR
ncbi:MAG: ABC transporter substrate-binding protein [Phycisphaerae bacterium]|nr:ABC transporter substrate-binding protein [Phycisphaerae bacterium]